MLTVEIKINGRHIAIVEAVRDKTNNEVNYYSISIPDYKSINLSTGKIEHWIFIGKIMHRYSDGAVVLGMKMLEMLKNNKNENIKMTR